MATLAIPDAATAALRAPFAPIDYEWRVQAEAKGGTCVRVLCYVTARAIQYRLDEVVGPWGWQTEYRSGPDGGVICRLSLRNPETQEWAYKEDGASNTDIEAVKGGISSALKRAASAWGVGRLLYSLPAHTVPLLDRGEHWHKTKRGGKVVFLYWNAPKLPSWAIAGGVESEPARTPPAESGGIDRKALARDRAFFGKTARTLLEADPMAGEPTQEALHALSMEAIDKSGTTNLRDAAIWMRDHATLRMGADGSIVMGAK